MGCSKLSGQWKVPCLVANGRWKKNTFLLLLTFPPTNLLELLIFSFDLEALLYHGSRSLLTPFLPFLQSINYDCASRCNKSFTPSSSIWFWLKIRFFSFPWNYGIVHGHILRALNRSSKWKIAFRIIFRPDINATSSWWRTWTSRGVCSSWNWTPLSLVLLYFPKLSHPGDLVASWPRFWWRT